MQLKAVHTVTALDDDGVAKTHRPGSVFSVSNRATGEDLIRRNAVTLIDDASDAPDPVVVTATDPAQAPKRGRPAKVAPVEPAPVEPSQTAAQEDPAGGE